jgi:tRNA G10  N-methylase Trm11
VFQASATDRKAISTHIQPGSIDIVFTDVPYGRHSQWQDTDLSAPSNRLNSMLDSLQGVLSASSILAIASDKQQKVSHEGFQRIEHFQVGKRRVVILKPV